MAKQSGVLRVLALVCGMSLAVAEEAGTISGMLEYVSTGQGCLAVVAPLAVVTGVVFQLLLVSVMKYVEKQPWWPRARPLQKIQMMNFGFPASVSDFAVVESFSMLWLFCLHHVIATVMMLPVAVLGWEAAGDGGQLSFRLACMADVALNVFDFIKLCLTTFCHGSVRWLTPEPTPKPIFIIIGLLHHTLALVMMVPMLLYYPSLRAFHLLAVSLLGAAGICVTTGAYKFTLDTGTVSGFRRFQAVVVAQLIVIWASRGFVWFQQVFVVLSTFWVDGSLHFLAAGCVVGAMMTVFNLLLLMDCTGAFKKWILVQKNPTVDANLKEMRRSTAQRLSCVVANHKDLQTLLTQEEEEEEEDLDAPLLKS